MPITKQRARNGVIITNEEQAVAPYSGNTEVYQPDISELKSILDEAVSRDEWVEIMRCAKEFALKGGPTGVKYMEFLAKYKFGLPAQMIAATGGGNARITIVEVVRSEGSSQTELKNDGVPKLVQPPSIEELSHSISQEESGVPF